MKAQINLSAFLGAVRPVAGFASTESDLKELQCLKIETEDKALRVMGFNRTCWSSMLVIGAEIEEPGAILLPATELRRYLLACPDVWPLEISGNDEKALLKTGVSTCNLSTLPVKNYPDPTTSTNEATTITMDARDLSRALSCVGFAAGNVEFQQVNTKAIAVAIDAEKINFMATDSKVLSLVQIPSESIHGKPMQEMLPPEPLNLLAPMIDDAAAVTISLTKAEFVAESERWLFGTRLLNAKAAPWRKMVEQFDVKSPDRIALPVKETIAAIRQAVAADPKELRLECKFVPGKAAFSTERSRVILDLPNCTNEMQFPATWEFLTDFLLAAGRQDLPVTMEFGDRKKAILFRAGTEWRYFVIPLID